ncbi:hypothetical protein LPB140_09815 [Sphingorhabdus lutea]|uniref:Uncharacterized protein n=1 Tax=Sphingorhabdus lutea TaxID=1913578 RepID=A0A1L3JD23_9SPHN|nr:hypothetical protein [Sphingorhabdus lutea]APG63035.1 hypothetical protein LPB140_09815 [Sphingorhabdus lutea]
MTDLDIFYIENHIFVIVGICAVILGAFSVYADIRRQNRTNLNNAGFMPWTAISVGAIMVALFSFALAVVN